jgi:4-amino-4-deoxy-L-arabinose transferase-like glycosyltransferase
LWRDPLAIALAGLALALRVVYVLVFRLNRTIETYEYTEVANNLLEGRGFGFEHLGTWYRSMGSVPFTLFCAASYAAFGPSQLPILVAQGVFSALTAFACYCIGARLFSRRVGATAAVLIVFHPGLFFYDTHKIHPLGVDASLMAFGILAILVGPMRSGVRVGFVGALHGLGILERATQAGLVPLTVLSIGRSAWKESRLCLLGWYLIAVVIVPGVWTVRNFVVYRALVLMRTTNGEIFWRGNNPVASGGGFAAGQPGRPVFDAAPATFRTMIWGKDEMTQSRMFSQEAMA